MNLENYLQRIQYTDPVRSDLGCLRAVHRHHVQSIPYEDLDVQIGRPLDLNPERIRRKLIVERRGGWCYEMNGLLGWALEEIGFNVTRMTGGVMRSEEGDAAFGNHLVLRVDLDDESWIADAGLGDALQEPIPLSEGKHLQNGRTYTLTQLDAVTWRFTNHKGRLPPTMDFINAPADEALFEHICTDLQTNQESMFVQNLICFRSKATTGEYLSEWSLMTNLCGRKVLKQYLERGDVCFIAESDGRVIGVAGKRDNEHLAHSFVQTALLIKRTARTFTFPLAL